ncbi:MAG: aldehyde ferredoxin oxidoreductase family protein [Lachnospiraceae bacterium]|nr:aldehyde ferredoxin oxidoreductase family protein [Lachnospiraceae bacterium]
MLGGYCGKFLRVNLTTSEIKEEQFSEEVLRQYIGGSGLGAKIVCEETDENTDPLGPDNVLCVFTGPFVGTGTPNFGRHQVVTKSPLTGLLGEGNSGGTWGMKLKHAGIDGFIFTGTAPKPVYIHVEDGDVSFHDAKELWGKDTFQVDDMLKEKYGKKTVSLSIGQAGENLVKSAAIMNDGAEGRCAARCGVGAVMGSKNLKAISVVGTKRPPMADMEKAQADRKKWAKHIATASAVFRKYGTAIGVETTEAVGDMPVKNWSNGNTDISNLTGQHIAETILKKPYFCGQCAIGCGRTVQVTEGKYASIETGGPEYETVGMLGSNCLINDLEGVQMANELCNRYGIDTISAGAAVSFAMEAYEMGIITKEMMDGDEIRWGNVDDVLKLLPKIVFRKGKVGNTLAEGTKRAGKLFGGLAQEISVDVKGLEIPAHDPRASDSTGLQYATSTRGACHLNSFTSDFTIPGDTCGFGFMPPAKMDTFGTEDINIDIVYHHQHVMAMMDSLTGCKFVMGQLGEHFMDCLCDWFKYVVGWDVTKEEFMKTGERIFNLKRMYQIKCGVSRKDDVLPPKMSKRRLTGGAGQNIPDVAGMLDRYYERRNWDDYGIPSKQLLKELSLDWLLDRGFVGGKDDAYRIEI